MERPRARPLTLVAGVALALLSAPARGEGDERVPVPGYALPEGITASDAPPPARRAAIAAAVRAVTDPRTPDAAREGWRILAGIGPAAAPAAVDALRAADWFGRALLVRALGSMEEPRLDPLLVEAAGDPSWAVREAAAEALGRASGPASAAAIPPLLADGSWRVRQAAVEAARRRALRGHLDRARLADALLELAAGGDPDVRFAACLALADLCEPRAVEPLLAALAAADASLPRGSPDDEAEGPDDGWRFRAALADALRLLRGVADGCPEDPRVHGMLWDLARQTTRPLAPFALREWFRLQPPDRRRDPAALDALVRAYVHPEGADPVAVAALERTLLDLGEDAARAILLVIAEPERARRHSEHAGRVRVALDLVVRLRGDRAAETLASILGDRRLRTVLRERAAELAQRLCPVPLGPLFRRLHADGGEDWGMQALILRGIVASGGDDVPAILAASLARPDVAPPPLPVRRAAVDLLRSRPDLRDESVVAAAIRAETDASTLSDLLGLLRGGPPEEVARTLGPWLDDPRERVRLAAADALGRSPGAATAATILRRIGVEDGRAAEDPAPGDDPEFAAAVEERRSLRAARLRTAFVAALRFAAGPDAGPALAALLRRPEPEVREAAAANLATLRDERAVPPLLAALAEERARAAAGEPPVPGLRDAMLVAVVSCGGPESDAFVARLLAGDDADARALALRALARADSHAPVPEGVVAVLERTAPGDPERALALDVIGHRRVPPRTEAALRALRDAVDDDERRRAIETLGLLRDPAAVGALAALLPAPGSPPPDEQAFGAAVLAAEALGMVRAREAVPHLAAVLRRSLGAALRGTEAVAPDAQFAVVAAGALGRCGGPEALRVLCEAAFDPAFSRAAEQATRAEPEARDPTAPRRSVLPARVEAVAAAIAAALGRFRDGPLSAEIRATLARLEEDGRAHAVSEEWLWWLGEFLGAPPRRHPYRPRWHARMVLMERILQAAPRETLHDREAHFRLFQHATEVAPAGAAATRHLAASRALYRVQDPFGADRESRRFDGLAAVAEGVTLLGEGREEDAVAAFGRAVEASAGNDAVARTAAMVLYRSGRRLDAAEALAIRAVRADPVSPAAARMLGRVRLAAGNAAGAVEPLTTAYRLAVGGSEGVASRTAWYAYPLAQALAATGSTDAALDLLGRAMASDDTALDRAIADPTLATLRAHERWEGILRAARESFDEP